MTRTDVRKTHYKFDLAALQRLAERNYAALLALLPATIKRGEQRFISVGEQLHFEVEVIDAAPFTTELRLKQSQTEGLPPDQLRVLQADIEVRLYHDAKMAEVTKAQGVNRIQARYEIPNKAMHQRDEKRQLNKFLADWLKLCREHGRADMRWAAS